MKYSEELLCVKMAYLTGYIDGSVRCGATYPEELEEARKKLKEVKKELGVLED